MVAGWPSVHVDHLDLPESVTELGTERTVEAIVSLGELGPGDVQVQLIHGPVGQGGELADVTIVSMIAAGPADDGHVRYAGAFTCSQAGRYGATVRVVPHHDGLVMPVELGLISWG